MADKGQLPLVTDSDSRAGLQAVSIKTKQTVYCIGHSHTVYFYRASLHYCAWSHSHRSKASSAFVVRNDHFRDLSKSKRTRCSD